MSKAPLSLALCTLAVAAAARAESLQAPALTLDPSTLFLDAAPASVPPAPPRDWVDQVKQPVSWFKWGADERLRIEYFNNAITLNQEAPGHEWNFFRYRTRLWGSVTPSPELQFNARLIWEGRHWNNPQSNAEHKGAAYKEEWDNSQGVFDALNAKITLAPIATTLTVGRQDIILGDGWLVLEGTPLDGSTTIYFDALRSTTAFNDIQTTLDLIYINQYADQGAWLPTLNDDERYVIENDERGAILWLTNKSLKNTEINPYFIYKHDDAAFSRASGGDDADIYTFGNRILHEFNAHWKARAEVAGQFGSKNNRDLAAFGANTRLGYSFNDAYKNELRFSFEYLSGDKPGDSTDQAFDPLWGRWPQWSELYVYTYAKETRIANTTNLLRFGPSYVVTPFQGIDLEFAYNALFANENSPRAGFADSGNYRGSLFSAILRYKFNRHLAGHLWSEYLVPGNFYARPLTDDAAFLRAELILTF